MEGVKRYVQALTVASPVPVQLVIYWLQMALIVMVSSLAISQCIMIYIALISLLVQYVFSLYLFHEFNYSSITITFAQSEMLVAVASTQLKPSTGLSSHHYTITIVHLLIQ